MQAYKLSALLRIVKQLDPRVLSEIATVPSNLWRDEEDRVIVNVSRGEIEWRLQCKM